MSTTRRWKAGTAALLALGLSVGTVTPIVQSVVAPMPVFAQTTGFSDVSSNYWAADFIAELSRRDVIKGFSDGTFRPDAPVTRAQFAAMLSKAFNKQTTRGSVRFVDVSSTYWAASAIQEAYTTGFMSGYPGGVFRPEQNIPREQVLVSLASGLNYAASGSASNTLSYYNDASRISSYATTAIAAATEQQIVVNYPNVASLNPQRNATRAEVAAFLYQALLDEGQITASINSPYIVSLGTGGGDDNGNSGQTVKIPTGTTIPIRYEKDKILLTRDETVPVTFKVAANITTANGTVLIPAGTDVVGELRPGRGERGTRFFAQRFVMSNGTQMNVQASSQLITKTETVGSGTNVITLVRNAAIGTAAAAAISAVTGDRAIATEELLLGAGAGGLATLIQKFLGQSSVDLLVVEPNTNLNLTLRDDLTVSSR